MASAFVTQTFATAWPALIALAMFGANRVLGNWRTALVCAAGQVAGTLVSEAITGYRVSRGLPPAAGRYIIGVGPSYVVVSAIVVALLYGSWLARAAVGGPGPADTRGGMGGWCWSRWPAAGKGGRALRGGPGGSARSGPR